ncbi:MAG TPA: beta-ketoacyl-ACP synthase III [Polyangiaceae bacterium]|jgi:3-oxoacyl-[acyl-carrier-protein] synthase-3
MPIALPRSRILGTGHYLPPGVRTNFDLEKMVETSDAWITERTGIKERRIAPDGVVTSDMATAAARQALEMAGLKATDLDMIIVGTVTPDMPMPATAVFVQQKLGAGVCPAFDLSAACAGFVFGLSIADQFIGSGQMKHVLVVGVELLSRVIDWTDRTTCVLFGDGAGAVVLGPSDAKAEDAKPRGILSTAILTDGGLAHSLRIPGGGSVTPTTADTVAQRLQYVQMRGQDIFKVAVKNLISASRSALERAGMTQDDIDWICPHQANKRIIDQVVARVEVPHDKVLMNIERVGNTSSASIPILLDESYRSGKIKQGDTVLMCALGAGISWGSAIVRL